MVLLIGHQMCYERPRRRSTLKYAHSILQYLKLTFTLQDPLVKMQILTFAAKLFILSPVDHTLGKLCRYVFSLGKYDVNYDVRDRTRMLTSLLSGVSGTYSLTNGRQLEDQVGGVVLRREQVKKVLFEGKSGIVEGDFQTSELGIAMSWNRRTHPLCRPRLRHRLAQSGDS